jgi:alkylation response protein AidB-like acyl-CoA dehydrogenase
MQFEFDEEQLSLQESVRRFLAERYDFETRRACLATAFGSSEEVWRGFAEQGLLSIGLPEAHGGIGGATELMLTLEETGRALVLEPYLSTVALCAPLIAELGTDVQQAELLPRVAAGSLKLALAHGEAEARYAATVRTGARRESGGFVLNGAKATVLDGGIADLLLVSARLVDEAGDALAVFAVEPGAPGVRVARYRTQDGRSAADVFLKDAKLDPGQLLGAGGDARDALERAVQRGIAALCAEAVGAMEAANATTIEYTKSRKQFGQPIGRFQALQHRMADMFVQATQARSMSVLAAGRCAAGAGAHPGDAEQRRRDVSAAKCYVGKAARFVGQQAVQLHGGMGMADELAVSHYFKRLTMIDMTFGDSTHHLAAVSDAILREPREPA